MSPVREADRADTDLTSVLNEVEAIVSAFFWKYRTLAVLALVGLLLLVASPLVVFGVDREQGAKWSETVKNVIESAAVIAALFAVIKWVSERRDRATDVLLKLDDEFRRDDMMPGRTLVETRDISESPNGETIAHLDVLLRFYVVLYGVLNARQVPERSLSICFRYWLSTYFRKDRVHFRQYVDRYYPTLRGWLHADCRNGERFFGPHRLFGEHTDDTFINQCRKTPAR